jgi:hypothetical protein
MDWDWPPAVLLELRVLRGQGMLVCRVPCPDSLREAGFTVRERMAIPMFNPEFEDDTYGKGLLAMMASFAVGRKGVTQSEADAWFAEFEALDKEGNFFFSLNRYLFVADSLLTPRRQRFLTLWPHQNLGW